MCSADDPFGGGGGAGPLWNALRRPPRCPPPFGCRLYGHPLPIATGFFEPDFGGADVLSWGGSGLFDFQPFVPAGLIPSGFENDPSATYARDL